MKAEHRHELKTNLLADWIANLPQWGRENLRMIIIVSVVAVLAVSSYLYVRYQRNVVSVRERLRLTEFATRLLQSKRDILNARSGGVDISYLLLQVADDLRRFTQGARKAPPAWLALALVERGEALRAELHYRPGTISRQDLTTQIQLAKDSYNEAVSTLETADAKRSILESLRSADFSGAGRDKQMGAALMAAAKFGLGVCEEELGNFEEAEQIYRSLTTNADFEGTVTVVEAKQRLERMGDYRQKVVFVARPKPEPPAPAEPPIPLRPPEANVPEAGRADTNLAETAGGDIYPGTISPAEVNRPTGAADVNAGRP
jgi:tetratricopeptide (TPR) repeat protein